MVGTAKPRLQGLIDEAITEAIGRPGALLRAALRRSAVSKQSETEPQSETYVEVCGGGEFRRGEFSLCGDPIALQFFIGMPPSLHFEAVEESFCASASASPGESEAVNVIPDK